LPFELHPRLAADTFVIGELALCRLLLMNDCRYPWLILVPRREALRDFDDVPMADKPAFHREIDFASAVLRHETRASKLNIGALGNMVPQLHVHVVARFEGDEAWPGPVWGFGVAKPYAADAATQLIARLARGFGV